MNKLLAIQPKVNNTNPLLLLMNFNNSNRQIKITKESITIKDSRFFMVRNLYIDVLILRALEAMWCLSAANIEKQAKVNGKVKVDAKNTSLEGSAKTNRSFKIDQTLDKAATWSHRRSSEGHVVQQVKGVNTNTEL